MNIMNQLKNNNDSIYKKNIVNRSKHLYGEIVGSDVSERIFQLISGHQDMRSRSVDGPYWTHEDIVLITYGDMIQSPSQPPLQTLRSFLNRNLPSEFSMLHLLPFFPYSSDDGFSITDFRTVNPQLGTWEDISALEESYDLVVDLVLNHCSRENLWFIDYLTGSEETKDFFIEMNPNENLTMVVRPRSTPVLTGVRTHSGMKHVWATFSNDQIDLNYKSPEVLLEFLDILLDYFRKGARMVRLDAVGYLWKEIGTSCIHLPQTHEVVKLFRYVLSLVEPGALIMTETNVPHDENITYFGNGDEAHVIYQFSLPPLLLHAIFSRSTEYLRAWAKELESMFVPKDCTFLNFTASHDGIGLRPLEGLVPDEKKQIMLDALRERGGYISTKRNRDGSESPYELNISYFDAFRDTHADMYQWHIPAFLLSQLFTLSFKGIPAVYIHSLFATPNDNVGVERTGMTRSINRRKWDRSELESLLANHESESGRVFHAYKKYLTIRREQHAFHPDASQLILNLGNEVFGLKRTAVGNTQTIIALYNFTQVRQFVSWQDITVNLLDWIDVLGECETDLTSEGITLPPYAAYWFSKRNYS